MSERHADFSYMSSPRRNGTPSDGRSNSGKQSALPPLTFERLSFLEGLEVIEDNSAEAWEAWDAAVRAGVFACQPPKTT